jgi:uncharacterized protein YdhG (YjbR/CyaY superfamily)
MEAALLAVPVHGSPLVEAFKKELAPYEVNNKGTIRFPLAEHVPVKLIAALARFRAKQVIEETKAKAATRKKRSGSRRQ